MKLLNVHKYRPGDRLQNIECPERIQVVKGMYSNSEYGKIYETWNDGTQYFLDEAYLDTAYRRIQ